MSRTVKVQIQSKHKEWLEKSATRSTTVMGVAMIQSSNERLGKALTFTALKFSGLKQMNQNHVSDHQTVSMLRSWILLVGKHPHSKAFWQRIVQPLVLSFIWQVIIVVASWHSCIVVTVVAVQRPRQACRKFPSAAGEPYPRIPSNKDGTGWQISIH